MVTTKRIVEAYVRHVKRWATISNIKMHRRSFLSLLAASCSALVPAGSGNAMKVPISTLFVDVLSVEHVASDRKDYRDRNGRHFTRQTDSIVAKVRIRQVIETDHHLAPGAIIEIKYDAVTYRPPMPELSAKAGGELIAGETVRVTVFGSGSSFRLRR